MWSNAVLEISSNFQKSSFCRNLEKSTYISLAKMEMKIKICNGSFKKILDRYEKPHLSFVWLYSSSKKCKIHNVLKTDNLLRDVLHYNTSTICCCKWLAVRSCYWSSRITQKISKNQQHIFFSKTPYCTAGERSSVLPARNDSNVRREQHSFSDQCAQDFSDNLQY